jgi:hypothetical protein
MMDYDFSAKTKSAFLGGGKTFFVIWILFYHFSVYFPFFKYHFIVTAANKRVLILKVLIICFLARLNVIFVLCAIEPTTQIKLTANN